MQSYFTDNERTLYQGDAWALAETLPPASIDCLVTSPPYWGLRDYGLPPMVFGGDPGCNHDWQQHVRPAADGTMTAEGNSALRAGHQGTVSATMKPTKSDLCARCGAWRGCFGLEPHPQMWLNHLVDLFLRLRPALKPTATIWLNLGDTYYSSPQKGDRGPREKNAKAPYGRYARVQVPDDEWLRPKQLLLLPSRAAIALQEAGFLLRNDMVWRKRNPMPSSVRDRLACTWEHLFLFTVAERYYFDLEAVREPHIRLWDDTNGGTFAGGKQSVLGGTRDHKGPYPLPNAGGKNPGDVRDWATQPFPEAHFAVFPEVLPEWCLRAGCPAEVCAQCGKPKVRKVGVQYGPKPGWGSGSANSRRRELDDGKVQAWDAKARLQREAETLGFFPTCACGAGFEAGTVLDPFSGAGTVLTVAKRKGLRGVGFELNPEYCEMAARRMAQAQAPLPGLSEAACPEQSRRAG